MQKKMSLCFALIGCWMSIQARVEPEIMEPEVNYKVQEKNRRKRMKKKFRKDSRYERNNGTNDLAYPNVEARESFDKEHTTPREDFTTQFQEYVDNH